MINSYAPLLSSVDCLYLDKEQVQQMIQVQKKEQSLWN